MTKRVAVIGGGAAGFFGAITLAEARPPKQFDLDVVVLEGTRRPLTKVRISGGGRCNVTHACFEPRALTAAYPRGERELTGPFSRFQPLDTLAWFKARGVEIKREDDGRMFPTTDDSETIAGCLERAAAAAGVRVRLGAIVKSVTRDASGFVLSLRDGDESFDRVLLATGGAPQGHAFAASLGHRLVSPVPSLFTFNVVDERLRDLAGLSFPDATLRLVPPGGATKLVQRGPLLITHWGLSGPAVLKLSAWGARELHATGYQAELTVNFLGDVTRDAALTALSDFKTRHGKKRLATEPALPVPRRYWQRIVDVVTGGRETSWADASKVTLQALAEQATAARFVISGKGVFKEEFVTAGGVSLGEVDFRTMQSRLVPGLFFAGEVLDVDGITGGYNFQNAWTTGHLAGLGIAGSLV